MNNRRVSKLACFLLLLSFGFLQKFHAQTGTVKLSLFSATDSSRIKEGIAYIQTGKLQKMGACDRKGQFIIRDVPLGQYKVGAFSEGFQTKEISINLNKNEVHAQIYLEPFKGFIHEVEIHAEQRKMLGLAAIEGTAIYEAKKSEVIEMKDLVANTANNNPRQIFGKITGLNIWESDGSGLQLGVGGRGLNPNRTSSFNTRQNGYDISADALGYPESYYTPPAELLDRIEVVRGAASLQYGTQFGGLLNFILKKGPEDTPFQWTSRLSGGSWNFLNATNTIGGETATGKLNYYAFFQHKQGDGWRLNSDFKVNTGYAALTWKPMQKVSITTEYTHMSYLAHQPGGLTDAMFADDPHQSVRSRNWFQINWNLAALIADFDLGQKTRLNIRNFLIHSGRQSLGNLERVTIADISPTRTLIDGIFKNIGNETRLLHNYRLFKQEHTGVIGFRVYRGNSEARQGSADGGKGPVFRFLNPGQPDNSDYAFPNLNLALFTEQIIRLSNKFSIVPGLRWEYIRTGSSGYYKQQVKDMAGNIIVESTFRDSRSRERSFLLGGLGMSYKPAEKTELYANFSQNYRAINFTDLRISNPSLRVDSAIRDESGFTADLGIRGSLKDVFRYELTAFCLYYKNRIGQILRADQPPLFQDYRFRTNIANARNTGIEMFADLNLMPFFSPSSEQKLILFVNAALIRAIYLDSKDKSVAGNQVEMVPPVMVRAGLSWFRNGFRIGIQHSYTAEHFSDASNAIRTSSAVEGIIPAYQVMDASCSYNWKSWTLELSLNNALNAMYFTRRADSYPGPGIIPADARNLTIGVHYVFRKLRG